MFGEGRLGLGGRIKMGLFKRGLLKAGGRRDMPRWKEAERGHAMLGWRLRGGGREGGEVKLRPRGRRRVCLSLKTGWKKMVPAWRWDRWGKERVKDRRSRVERKTERRGSELQSGLKF